MIQMLNGEKFHTKPHKYSGRRHGAEEPHNISALQEVLEDMENLEGIASLRSLPQDLDTLTHLCLIRGIQMNESTVIKKNLGHS